MRQIHRLRTPAALSAVLLGSTALCAAGLFPSRAEAKTAYLAAVRTCIDATGANAGNCSVSPTPLPTDPVPVWSFVEITSAEFSAKAVDPATLTKAVVPGPLLSADDSGGLTVNLLNTLPVPVSLIIPGQPGALAPVWFNPTTQSATGTGSRPAGDVTSRVRSLNTETAPGATGTYSWAALTPGSYIYQSGTHQAVQVQMGLHGGLIVASGATVPGQASGTAYPGVTYARQVVTYLSEIDAAMHRTIDLSPTYDATPAGAPANTTVSPLEYWPNQFLTTQRVLAPDFTPVASVGGHGQLQPNTTTLMRFMNGTLRTHVQVVQNEYVNLVAEDGNPYRYGKSQYSVLLEAGKTKDALMAPTVKETIAVYDRMLNTGGAGTTKQGMVALLDIGKPGVPVANNDSYATPQGQALTVAAPGVLANDTSPDGKTLVAKLGTNAKSGTVMLNADGSFTYTPAANSIATSDAFSYTASEGTGTATLTSNSATVALTLTPAAPVAVADAYAATNTKPLVVGKPGVLANDTPVGVSLTARIGKLPAHGTLAFNTDGSFTYTAATGYTGADSFTYTAANGTMRSAEGTVTLNVTGNPLVASNDYFVVNISSTGNVLPVLANDTGWAAGYIMKIVSQPTQGGKATANADGTVTYAPKPLWVGTDSFTYQFSGGGKVSGTATVKVDVVRP